MAVVQGAQRRDGYRSPGEHGHFQGAAVNAVDDQSGGRKPDPAQFQPKRPCRQRQENSRQYCQAARQRNRRVMNFSVARIVHETDPEAPLPPVRQRQQRGQPGTQKGGRKKIEGKIHGWKTNVPPHSEAANRGS